MVWIADVLPDEMAGAIDGMIEQGMATQLRRGADVLGVLERLCREEVPSRSGDISPQNYSVEE